MGWRPPYEHAGLPGVRVKLNRPVEIGPCAVALALHREGRASLVEADRAKRIHFDRLVEILKSPVVFALAKVSGTAGQIGTDITGREVDGFAEVVDGTGIFAHAHVGRSPAEKSNGETRIEGYRTIEVFHGLAQPVVRQTGTAPAEVEAGVCRIELDGLVELLDCTVESADDHEGVRGSDEDQTFTDLGGSFRNVAKLCRPINAAGRNDLTCRRILGFRKVPTSTQANHPSPHGE